MDAAEVVLPEPDPLPEPEDDESEDFDVEELPDPLSPDLESFFSLLSLFDSEEDPPERRLSVL